MEQNFGEFLKTKRQEKKLTQKELSKLLFVSESAVSKWEKNIAHPDITLLPKLSEILGVTEHELITSSIDNKAREEKSQAKKWRAFSLTWSLFFYIAYTTALIPCFICNLAINKTLSWFWIVISSLLLAFTFTNLPKLIKKHKLILIPLSMYLALCILLGVCCIYSKGNWFLIPCISVLLGLVIIFTPIYISKYNIFSKIRKFSEFISVAVAFIVLNILLIVIDIYTIINNYSANHWYFKFALPISISIYLILNLFLCIKFIKVNKLLKTSITLALVDFFLYIVPLCIHTNNEYIQKELNDINIFKADFSNWKVDITLEQNIHCIIFLSILLLSITFCICGILLHFHRKRQKQTK